MISKYIPEIAYKDTKREETINNWLMAINVIVRNGVKLTDALKDVPPEYKDEVEKRWKEAEMDDWLTAIDVFVRNGTTPASVLKYVPPELRTEVEERWNEKVITSRTLNNDYTPTIMPKSGSVKSFADLQVTKVHPDRAKKDIETNGTDNINVWDSSPEPENPDWADW